MLQIGLRVNGQRRFRNISVDRAARLRTKETRSRQEAAAAPAELGELHSYGRRGSLVLRIARSWRRLQQRVRRTRLRERSRDVSKVGR